MAYATDTDIWRYYSLTVAHHVQIVKNVLTFPFGLIQGLI